MGKKRKSESLDPDTKVKKENIKTEYCEESIKDESMKKEIKPNENAGSWEEKIKYLSPISQPLATKKLTKKLYKTIKKASKCQSLRKGIKEVQKSLRKGEKGIVVLAGDVSPLDIISHVPIMCEEGDVPYCYTPSKAELGEAMGSKRQACMVLIKEHEDFKEDFEECKTRMNEIPRAF